MLSGEVIIDFVESSGHCTTRTSLFIYDLG